MRRVKAWSGRRWSSERCARYIDELRNCFARLSEYPMLGHACDEVRPGYRMFPIGEHHIYYRIDRGGVLIAHVRPQVMDVTAGILDESGRRP